MAEFVEGNFGSMTVAKTLDKIDKNVNVFTEFPERGVLDRKYSTLEYIVRHVNVGSNVIYYMAYPSAIVIGIIVHQEQSPKRVDAILKRFLEHYER